MLRALEPATVLESHSGSPLRRKVRQEKESRIWKLLSRMAFSGDASEHGP